MRFIPPEPYIFEGGSRAVLLLHGFTGNSADCRMLARYLEKRGYTCHAPQFKGHGVRPEELFETDPEDWWQDVMDGYELLKKRGHKEIAAAGLSLGGVFSLKLGYTVPIKGIISMCAPMYMKNEEAICEQVQQYVKNQKRHEGKLPDGVENEIAGLRKKSKEIIESLQRVMAEVRDNLDMIYAPTFVVQACNDERIHLDSAQIIYSGIQSPMKEIKWYKESGHVITIGKERNQLNEDVYQFLEKLDWEDKEI